VIKNRTWARNQNWQILEFVTFEYTDWSNSTDPHLLRKQFIDLNTDVNFKAPVILSANAFVKRESPTYVYQLEIAPKRPSAVFPPVPSWMGVYHGADLIYMFGFPLTTHGNFTTGAEITISKDMMTLWSNFAKTG